MIHLYVCMYTYVLHAMGVTLDTRGQHQDTHMTHMYLYVLYYMHSNSSSTYIEAPAVNYSMNFARSYFNTNEPLAS